MREPYFSVLHEAVYRDQRERSEASRRWLRAVFMWIRSDGAGPRA